MNQFVLTPPPSSNEDDSPQIYYLASPTSSTFLSPDENSANSFKQIANMDILANEMAFNNEAHLSFVEEPIDKFRFRYKSEMSGTHGCLNGISSQKQRQQTFPTVELMNFNQPAIIRCSIYQCRNKTDSWVDGGEELQPHAHRLIRKCGREEQDDPHEIEVSPETGYQAVFTGMGIIHTARKHVEDELKRKMTQLKEEEIARKEGKLRKLNEKEKLDITKKAEENNKTINLNIVCLRFDAFVKTTNGVLHPICPPLYSNVINNLKSALTGELKIVRMDHCSSPASGNREIFIFVERVTKKNVKIRFYELDDSGEEVWSDYGKFNDADVHHQYAIAFRTPRYKDQDIQSKVKVYMELVRPTDNARSESKEFSYTPNIHQRPGTKRPRYTTGSCYSSSSDFDSQFSTNGQQILPVPVLESSLPALTLNSHELSEIADELNLKNNPMLANYENPIEGPFMNDYGSNYNFIESQWYTGNPQGQIVAQMEGERLFENWQLKDDIPVVEHQMATYETGPSNQAVPEGGNYYPNFSKSFDGGRILVKPMIPWNSEFSDAIKFFVEFKKFIKTSFTDERAVQFLNHYLNRSKDKLPTNNPLHVLMSRNRLDVFIIEFIKKYDQTQILNLANANNETLLHIAVRKGNHKMIEKLLQCNAELHVLDSHCNTPLHTAVIEMASIPVVEAILAAPKAKQIIDETNDDGYSPLHLAVRLGNLSALKLLCQKGANINLQHTGNGFTPLRMAVDSGDENVLRFILSHSSLQPLIADFAEVTPFEVAYTNQSSKIFPIITKYMEENSYNMDIKEEKMEDISEEEAEMDVDIPFVAVKKEEIRDISELYENVTCFTDDCINKLSNLLNNKENWTEIADCLNLGHYVRSGLLKENETKKLLNLALEENHKSIFSIRNCLEQLHIVDAVEIIDDMVKKIQI